MNRLDKLIKQAKKHGKGKYKYILCFIEYNNESGKYGLSAQLWDGREGMEGSRDICSEHDSVEEAENEYNAIVAKYKDAKCTLIVDDFSFPEWCENEEA